MPTGYTHGVQEGTITTLREFALKCARAFGANVMMRDEPSEAPIREYTPDPWHAEEVKKAKQRLAEIERMTLDQCRDEADKEYEAGMVRLREYQVRREAERRRYESMLTQVECWTPPTDDHREFKTFMLDQLRQSIDFDCDDISERLTPKRVNGATWRAENMHKALRDVEYHQHEHEKEVERTAQRNAWNRALLESVSK